MSWSNLSFRIVEFLENGAASPLFARKTARRCLLVGANHRSTIIDCGFSGVGGRLSIINFLEPNVKLYPRNLIVFLACLACPCLVADTDASLSTFKWFADFDRYSLGGASRIIMTSSRELFFFVFGGISRNTIGGGSIYWCFDKNRGVINGVK